MNTTKQFNYMRFSICLLIILFSGESFALEKTPIRFEEIKTYANFSSSAYQPISKIKDIINISDYTLTHANTITDAKMSYFVASNHKTRHQIIAIRGTVNEENVVIDSAIKLVFDKHAGIPLHEGFSHASKMIYAELAPYLKRDYTISTTGHSLGGAIASILTMYLNVDKYNVGSTITFGQPKVTNLEGAARFDHLNIIRVVTEKDIVPLIPPFDPIDFNNIDIYWHIGREVVLLANNTYAVMEGLNSMLRFTNFTQAPLTKNNIRNHDIGVYISLIDKKIPNAKLVSFKNNFNLFNLFGN